MRKGNNISILNLSYVREVDNKNLLSGELDTLFNLTPPFLLVSSARQSLTRFGHRVCNACIASLSLAHKLTNALPAVKLLSQSNFILVPSYIRGGVISIILMELATPA